MRPRINTVISPIPASPLLSFSAFLSLTLHLCVFFVRESFHNLNLWRLLPSAFAAPAASFGSWHGRAHVGCHGSLWRRFGAATADVQRAGLGYSDRSREPSGAETETGRLVLTPGALSGTAGGGEQSTEQSFAEREKQTTFGCCRCDRCDGELCGESGTRRRVRARRAGRGEARD